MRRSSFLLLLAVVFVTCTNPPSGPPPADSSPSCSLLPGATGNWWIYIDSTWRDGALLPVHDDTLRITGSDSQNGRVMQIAQGSSLFPSRFIPGCDTLFVLSFGIGGQPFFSPYYIRGSRPPDTLFTVLGDIGFEYLAEELGSPVETPAGSFANCTRISLFSVDQVDETILFPGVGIVRRQLGPDIKGPNFGSKEVLTLKKTNVVLIGK